MAAVLRDGDVALFDPTFGAATVVVRPGELVGSGPALSGGRKLCVQGDEASVSVAGCIYVTATHPIPGTGTLRVAALARGHGAAVLRSGGKGVLVRGGDFQASLKVDSPAAQPAPGGGTVPDATPEYRGAGRFLASRPTFGAA